MPRLAAGLGGPALRQDHNADGLLHQQKRIIPQEARFVKPCTTFLEEKLEEDLHSLS